ncbi:MAG: RHS repeat-associated core domain-containing protein, partial [Pyrinomonadaceae bacterium]
VRTIALGYTGDAIRQRFTSYERDSETGLDFAQARYYANMQGRFASVDPLMASASAGNPQTWNRYAYVGNDPLNATDPSGMIGSREPVAQYHHQKNLGLYGNLFSAVSYDESWIGMQDRALTEELAQLIATSKTEIRVTDLELLGDWGDDPTSPAVGKGGPAPFDFSRNPSQYIIDVQQGGVDPKSSIFTIAITFKGFKTDGWVPDSLKVEAPKDGRWKLAETPTGLGKIRTREKGDLLTVLLNLRAQNLAARNRPISVMLSAYYTSLYRRDQKPGIERLSVTAKVQIRLLIGETSSKVVPVP